MHLALSFGWILSSSVVVVYYAAEKNDTFKKTKGKEKKFRKLKKRLQVYIILLEDQYHWPVVLRVLHLDVAFY